MKFHRSYRQELFSFASHHAKGEADEKVRTRPWLLLSSGLSWLDFMRYTATSKRSLRLWYTGLGAGALCEVLAGLVPSWWLAAAAALCWAAAVAVLVRAVRVSSSTKRTLVLKPDPEFFDEPVVHDGETTRFRYVRRDQVAAKQPEATPRLRPVDVLWFVAYLGVAAGAVCLLLAAPARSWFLVAAAVACWVIAAALLQWLGRPPKPAPKQDDGDDTGPASGSTRGTVTWSVAQWDRDLLAQLWAADQKDPIDQPELEWDPEPWCPTGLLKEQKKQVMLASYTRARPFNGPVAAQMSDVTAESLAKGEAVRLREARYFDLVCTNYLTDKLMTWTDGSHAPLRGVDLIRGPDHRLLGVDENGLADTVGVSTIAIDDDFRTIVVGQSKDSLSSAELLAPSGSGSLEPRDLRTLLRYSERERPSAFEMLKIGMNRELVEEANIDSEWIGERYLVGYYRWIDKGAKPEYLGVTFIRRSTETLRRKQRAVESKWVKGVLPGIHLDLRRLMLWPSETDASIWREKLGDLTGRLSVPLAMGLMTLGLRMRSEKHAGVRDSLFDRLRPALAVGFTGVEEILPGDPPGREWAGRLEDAEHTAAFTALRPDTGATTRRDPLSNAVAVKNPDGRLLAAIPARLPTTAGLKEIVLGADTVWVRTDDDVLHPAPQQPGHGVDWGSRAGVGLTHLALLVDGLLTDPGSAVATDGTAPPDLAQLLARDWPVGTVLSRTTLEGARVVRPS